MVEAQGGKIIGEILVPQNTRDFTSYLLRLQQMKPDVVAAAVGGDDQKSMRQQVIQAGLHKRMAWINNQQDWPDVYGLGPDAMFGVFGTTWYYRLDLPGVKEFVAQYQKTFPGMAIRVPGNVYYNGYMATRELLRACERAGSTNNIAVIKQLENLKVSARDRMQHFDAYMNPATHQMQQTIYMASYNDTPAEKDDIFKIMSWVPPAEVEDKAAVGACKLESYEATTSVRAIGVGRRVRVACAVAGRLRRFHCATHDAGHARTASGQRHRARVAVRAARARLHADRRA